VKSSTNPLEYTATFTPDANATGTASIGILAGKFADASGNQNTDTYQTGAGNNTETDNQITPVYDTRVSSAVVDTATAKEAGGVSNNVPGQNISQTASSGVLGNDAGGTLVVQDVKLSTATSASAVSTGTTSSDGTSIVGQFGTLVLGADGSYTYVVNNSKAAVQALRTSTDTLTETFTYTALQTVTQTTSSATLTITIEGSNDGPVATADTASAAEA
jgi:VCBS repeat-containing protein